MSRCLNGAHGGPETEARLVAEPGNGNGPRAAVPASQVRNPQPRFEIEASPLSVSADYYKSAAVILGWLWCRGPAKPEAPEASEAPVSGALC